MARTDDTTAYASNWKMVLAADACLGVILLICGALVALVLQVIVGAIACVVSILYLVLVWQRARKWKRLRADAGL